MKKTINILSIIFLYAVVFFGIALTSYGQKSKISIPKPEANVQFRVAPGASQTNPEFIKRLADPELNPEFTRRIPDPTARLKEAQTLADQFCQNFNISVSLGSDPQGCYIDITITHTYTYASGTNACILPHGIYIEVCSQATIQSATVISGAWFTGSTFQMQSNPSAVYWVKQCQGSSNYSNLIPSGQLLNARIRLTSEFCPGNCAVTIRELTGWAYPNLLQFWSCEKIQTISVPPVIYSIGPNTSVCTGSAFTINILTPPSPGSVVKWYKDIPANPCDPCPPASCPILSPPWVLAQTGGNTYNTNILTQTTCYVAVVQSGCGMWVTNVRRVNVCQGLPSAAITATPAPGYPQPTIINQVPHACTLWSGRLCLDPFPCSCPTTIIRWQKRTRVLSYPSSCSPQWGGWSSWTTIPGSAGLACINTGILGYSPVCQNQYELEAILQNACGQSMPSYTIVIDRPPVPGSITANPLPPLCYDKATKLTYSTSCAEVVEWEMREELSPCTNAWGPSWTAIAGSQGTCVWWTNNLQKTTQYRAKVKNGACPPVYSQMYTVTVKPKLFVTISANQTFLCPPGVTLTAQTTYGSPCNYPVSYQWYQDGLSVAGATGSTYSPKTCANYYVVVYDKPCGKATSNVITVCGRPQLAIEAPCCVCKGETITLTAKVLWCPNNCQPPSCTYHWNTGATTPSISVTSPGTYTVTVNCGTCPPLTQNVTIIPCQ